MIKTLIYLFFHFFQPLSLLLSSRLANFSSLTDYSLVKLTSKVFFNFSYIAKIIKFLPDNNNIQFIVFRDSTITDNSNLILQIDYVIYFANTTNKANLNCYLIK